MTTPEIKNTTSQYYTPGLVMLLSKYDFGTILVKTDEPFNWAINGEGFFIFQLSETGEVLYSKEGKLFENQYGYISADNGSFLQGYPIYNNQVHATLSPIKVSEWQYLPEVTTEIKTNLNLSWETSAYKQIREITIYDSLGEQHIMQLMFRCVEDNSDTTTYYLEREWDVTLYSMKQNSDRERSLQDENKVIIFPKRLTPNNKGEINLTEIQLDFSQVKLKNKAHIGNTNNVIAIRPHHQFVVVFGKEGEISQNGAGFGVIETVKLEPNGIIKGVFTNGMKRSLYQIPLAKFYEMDSLKPVDNMFSVANPNIKPTMIYGQDNKLFSGYLNQYTGEENVALYGINLDRKIIDVKTNKVLTGIKIGNAQSDFSVEEISLKNILYIPAQATTALALRANLPTMCSINDNHTFYCTIYTASGNKEEVSFTFQKTDIPQHAPIYTSSAWFVTSNYPILSSSSSSHMVTFGINGLPNQEPDFEVQLSNNQKIKIELGTVNMADGLVAFANELQIYKLLENGYAIGTLQSLYVSKKQQLVGLYSNGVSVPLYRLQSK